MDWTTDLPTKPGRYFIRPAGSSRQAKVMTVRSLWGDDHLVAMPSPELMCAFGTFCPLDRVAYQVCEERLEWAFIDADYDKDWNHYGEPRGDSWRDAVPVL